MANPNPDTSGLRAPWKPGESGNPSGREEGSKNFTTLVREMLDEIAEGKDKDGKPLTQTYKVLLAKRILKKAIEQGDTRMIELVWNYLDGKPRGNIDLGFDKKSLGELTSFFRGMANGEEAAEEPK